MCISAFGILRQKTKIIFIPADIFWSKLSFSCSILMAFILDFFQNWLKNFIHWRYSILAADSPLVVLTAAEQQSSGVFVAGMSVSEPLSQGRQAVFVWFPLHFCPFSSFICSFGSRDLDDFEFECQIRPWLLHLPISSWK